MTKDRMMLLKVNDEIIDIFTSKICIIKKLYKDGSIVVYHPNGYLHRFNILEHDKISEVF